MRHTEQLKENAKAESKLAYALNFLTAVIAFGTVVLATAEIGLIEWIWSKLV